MYFMTKGMLVKSTIYNIQIPRNIDLISFLPLVHMKFSFLGSILREVIVIANYKLPMLNYGILEIHWKQKEI